MTAFDDLLANPRATKRYLVILAPVDRDTGLTVSLYLSTHPFTTSPTDDPADTIFTPRIANALSFTQRVAEGDLVRGPASSQIGEIEIHNGSKQGVARIDHWVDYLWSGTPVCVMLGGDGFAYDEYEPIFTGTADDMDEPGTDRLSLRIRDNRLALEVPFLTSFYAGTGGNEGGANQKDAPKPETVGAVRNIEGVYVGLDGNGDSVFQVNTGTTHAIDAGYSNGKPLTEIVGNPAIGQFSTDLANGLVTVGGDTLGTTITFDVRGNAAGGYVDTAATTIERVVTAKTGVEMVTGTVAALDTLNSATVGVHVTDANTTISTVVRLLADAVGAIDVFNRFGKLRLFRLDRPKVTADAEYTDVEILDITRLATVRPLKKVRVGHTRNHRVIDADSLAADPSVDRDFMTTEYRYESHEAANFNAGATDDTFDTVLQNEGAAGTEATRLHGFYSETDGTMEVVLKIQPFARQLGDTIRLTSSKHNIAEGRNFVILAMTQIAEINQVTMIVRG